MSVFVDIMLGGASALFASATYSLLKDLNKSISVLQNAPVLCENDDIASLLKENPKGVYGCLLGSVKTFGNHLQSVNRSDVIGAAHKISIKHHMMVNVFGIWSSQEEVVSSTLQTVPFAIMVGGNPYHVNSALLEEIQMTVVHETFRPANESFISSIVSGVLKTAHKTGIQTTEEMLCEKTNVVGFGNICEKGGKLFLEKKSELPYMILTKSKEMRVYEGKFSIGRVFGQAHLCTQNRAVQKNLVIIIMICVGNSEIVDKLPPVTEGHFLCINKLFEDIIKLWELETPFLKILFCVTAASSIYFGYRLGKELFKKISSKYEDWKLKSEWYSLRSRFEKDKKIMPSSLLCVVCDEEARNISFNPCNHVVICFNCFQKLRSPKQCPVCRQPVRSKTVLFYS